MEEEEEVILLPFIKRGKVMVELGYSEEEEGEAEEEEEVVEEEEEKEEEGGRKRENV